MGSPLSPVLANLCMEFVEKDILNRCDPEIKPIMWVRYVDDIFILFKGDENKLNRLVEFANNILPSIKFTTEMEVDFRLAFLDISSFNRSCSCSFAYLIYSSFVISEIRN